MLLANALLADERLTATRTVGVLLGIAGTAVMVGPGLLANLGGPVWAKFALIGTALSYACAAIFARRFRMLRPELVATGQLTASTVVMIPVVLLLYDPSTLFAASAGVWAAVLALALVAIAFAYILFFSVLASAGSSNTSLVTLVVPVSAILLGALFLGERLELFELAGMALIAVGLLVIDGRILRR
jgi:drug/metabolite transporter (DMT)-like permease